MVDRRRFLKQTAAGLGASVALPVGHAGARAPAEGRRTPRERAEQPVLVFQGDSVTDAGRSRGARDANDQAALGHGYAAMAAAHVLRTRAGEGWQVYNRGVSGNKVYQLADRWEEDCLALEPDVLSILIGVNDYWHTLTHDYEGTVETYERDYRALMDRTREALPDVALVIGEPFALPDGTAADASWQEPFGAYQAAARRVADDYGAAWVPYQSVFEAALRQAPAAHWCPDGVHPALPGNYLMMQAWADAFEEATAEVG